MQSENSQDQESGPSGKRSTSFGRFIKKTCSLAKKEKAPTSTSSPLTSETPVPEEEEPYITGISYPRPRRHHNPTDADLNNNLIGLQTALNDTWPRRHHSRYRGARALLVCWADNSRTDTPVPSTSPTVPHSPGVNPYPTPVRTSSASNDTLLSRATSGGSRVISSGSVAHDMGQGPFIPAAHQLASVFERRYGIQSQVWMIPTLESPQDMLQGKVKQFVDDYGRSDHLLIFWYGGHAEFVSTGVTGGPLGRDRNAGEIIWYGLRDELGVAARTICKVLSNARADVLFLNDSPFSQHAYMSHLSGPGTFELLGSGSITPSHVEPNPAREASFTRTLTLMLDSPFLAAHGVSVLELHRKLIDILSPKGGVLEALSVRTSSPDTSAPTADAAADAERSRGSGSGSSAWHRHHPHASLVVALAPKTAQVPPYPVYCQVSQAEQLERDARRTIVLSRLDTSLAAETSYARNVGEPRVRLDIRLARPVLDVRRWREWILRAPEEAQEVLVSGGVQT
ncbi:hypothetical protein GGS24DRAFT_507745 [Hypoxylon argillaceum]|nr:hypothetical protein GGS24DRAFT_507745 [Hypoxylon argillaceum]